jgi:hypothetical protein
MVGTLVPVRFARAPILNIDMLGLTAIFLLNLKLLEEVACGQGLVRRPGGDSKQ